MKIRIAKCFIFDHQFLQPVTNLEMLNAKRVDQIRELCNLMCYFERSFLIICMFLLGEMFD